MKKIKKNENPAATLSEKRSRLLKKSQKIKAFDFLERHSNLLDDYFIESYEKSMIGPLINISRKPYALIALGGYGRQEQCICSDIDILFLFKKSVPDETEELVREIIYPLWDLGLEVGHSTRTIKECINLAGSDLAVFTSLLDARFICGMSPLYMELKSRMGKKFMGTTRRPAKRIIKSLVEINNDRHMQFGDSTYRLEPNLKEGQGGLRDYHTMLWISRVAFQLKMPRDLEYMGYLSHDEYREFSKALGFIWMVRNHLHALTGRKLDQLHFEYQIIIAEKMNFKPQKGQKPVERFLGELHMQMEYIKRHNLLLLGEVGLLPNSKFMRAKKTDIHGLAIVKNKLEFNSLEDVIENPNLLMKIHEESSVLNLPLSSEAQRIVKEFLYLVGKKFRSDDSNIKSFERVLTTQSETFNVLNMMLNTGFLIRFIPELKGIVNRIQYDEYHLFPVDRHCLRTVRTIKNFENPDSDSSNNKLFKDLYKELGTSKKILLWAALLHDIGKGQEGGGHAARGAETAKTIMDKFNYNTEHCRQISFLVKEHLLLVKTATRRDIHDEETAISCARTIKEARLLKMLYLLTVADSISTGPKAWNDWTAALLRDFFFKVLNVIEKGKLASSKALLNVSKKKAAVLKAAGSSLKKQDIQDHLAIVSPRYLLYTSAEMIISHMELYHGLDDNDFVLKVSRNKNSDTRTVTLCAKDRPGLFSTISGIFTLNSLNILDAQAYTWKNNIALDIFKVMPPVDSIFEDECWARVKEKMQDVLKGDLDLGQSLKKKTAFAKSPAAIFNDRPQMVKIDNKSSSFFTIIEVFAYDYPGLLFSITDVLFRQNIDVRIAKIATKIDQVVDVFYVRDFEGEKVDSPMEEEKLKKSIEAVLPRAYYKTDYKYN